LGLPLSEPTVRADLQAQMRAALEVPFAIGPIMNGETLAGGEELVATCPHDRREELGTVRMASPEEVEEAIASACATAHEWDMLGGQARADILEKAADLFERDRARLMAVIVREAGKTLENA